MRSMALLSTGEGEDDGLKQWLDKWKLGKYEDNIREQGIEAPDDFKYIKSKSQFDQFVSKLGDIPFMHTLKLQDAWTSIVPETEQQQSQAQAQIHFLGDKEKEILNKLSDRYTHISNDIAVVQKANNGMI